MNTDDAAIKKRFIELSGRAFAQSRFAYTDFLTTAEQSVLLCCKKELDAPYTLWGGHERCERRIAVFGSEELCGFAPEPPIACLQIKPKSARFADELTHRDFLGALLGLGLRREVIGDIFVSGEGAYVFCMESVSRFVVDSLDKVGRTAMVCDKAGEAPEQLGGATEEISLNVPSERIDAVVGALYKLSRSQSQQLFAAQRVFVNARVTESCSKTLAQGDVVSVRGYGRFTYLGKGRETRKGRAFITIERPI